MWSRHLQEVGKDGACDTWALTGGNHAWKFLRQFGPTLFGTVQSLVPNKDKFKMAT